MFIDPQTKSILPSARRAMFIDPNADDSALRQEGHVYRPNANEFALLAEGHVIDPNADQIRVTAFSEHCPPDGGPDHVGHRIL